MAKAKLTLLPLNKTIWVETGQTLQQALAENVAVLETPCGGKGTCGKCRLEVLAGARELTPAEERLLSAEEAARGVRLACQVVITGDMAIKLPEELDYAIRKTGLVDLTQVIPLESSIRKVYLELPRPSLDDQRDDWERLCGCLGLTRPGVGISVLRDLPRVLRQAEWKVTGVLRGEEVLAVEAGDTTGDCYGVAFDLGTTTVVGSLIDLNRGRQAGVASGTNAQSIYGADVISRINYADSEPDGLQNLQEKIRGVINEILAELQKKTGIGREQIYEATVVGNTTMHHLFLGLYPAYIARAPYIPALMQPYEIKARELGINIHSEGIIHVIPNIAGYVGADTVGVLLATRIDQSPEIKLVIDIGTNGELVMGSRDRLYACSTAAGPAFEGAQIKFGMRAATGAIEGVRIENDEVILQVIGDSPPRGICGSGLIDVIAEMLKAGIIDTTGRILPPEELEGKLGPGLLGRIRPGDNGNEFVLAESGQTAHQQAVAITQKDIRELQLAKGAIMAGIQILKKELGITDEELAEIQLAGAFGSYIKRESARTIGLVPHLPLERINSIGNAAGVGSQLALISASARQEAASLARMVEYIELSSRADFQEEFMKALYFPQP